MNRPNSETVWLKGWTGQPAQGNKTHSLCVGVPVGVGVGGCKWPCGVGVGVGVGVCICVRVCGGQGDGGGGGGGGGGGALEGIVYKQLSDAIDVERSSSAADKPINCAFYDKSMKFSSEHLHIM